MQAIDRKSPLWGYLSEEIKGLVVDGEAIIDQAEKQQGMISDFSYLVFPFSKAYEGFLKRFFLDLELISEDEYYSDDIRIGRILNPHFLRSEGNIFDKICDNKETKGNEGREIAEKLWAIWKRGRNLVFHYFPHNFRRLSYIEAVDIVNELVDAMETAVIGCKLNTKGN